MHKLVTAPLLTALPCFEACARHLSFTRAAQELNVIAGAVSQQIRQLEERIGRPLFNRLARNVSLTPAGETLLAAVKRSFAQLSLALADIDQPEGPLRLSCSPSFAMLWLMPRLKGFYQAHPGIDILLVAEFQDLDRASFSAGQIDAAIRYDVTDYKGMDVLPLMAEFLFPLASPVFIAQHADAVNRRTFAGLQLLQDAFAWHGAKADVEWRTWREGVAAKGLQAEVDAPDTSIAAKTTDGALTTESLPQDFNLFMIALSAARNHQGVCMARGALVHDDIASGALVHFTGTAVQSPASYKFLSGRADDPRVQVFGKWLQQEAALFSANTQ
ncbi:MAG: LysR family transcriptional regulator [Comamonadaceae bacterium]|nr:MAG: LysR family transcriptional regulator [Comamonadaceae bacterium]